MTSTIQSLCISMPETLLHVTLKRRAEISADIFARLLRYFFLSCKNLTTTVFILILKTLICIVPIKIFLDTEKHLFSLLAQSYRRNEYNSRETGSSLKNTDTNFSSISVQLIPVRSSFPKFHKSDQGTIILLKGQKITAIKRKICGSHLLLTSSKSRKR